MGGSGIYISICTPHAAPYLDPISFGFSTADNTCTSVYQCHKHVTYRVQQQQNSHISILTQQHQAVYIEYLSTADPVYVTNIPQWLLSTLYIYHGPYTLAGSYHHIYHMGYQDSYTRADSPHRHAAFCFAKIQHCSIMYQWNIPLASRTCYHIQNIYWAWISRRLNFPGCCI